MVLNYNLLEQIQFLNVGGYKQEDTYFQWKSKSYYSPNIFDIRMARNAPKEKMFYCYNKEDQKLVYYLEKDIVFIIGADPIVQSQLIDALLEHLIIHFFVLYEVQLEKIQHGEISHFFTDYNILVHDVFENYNRLDLFRTAYVNCKGCQKNFNLIIKKSIKFDKPTATLVYIHNGHALLVYIDKQYAIRGSEIILVNY